MKRSDLSQIKLIVSDFDGVMTDNRVLVGEDSKEYVLCNRSDGLGISELKKIGIEIVVLSQEKNKVVRVRCRKLKIKCFQGCLDKLSRLKEIARKRKLRQIEIAYVGNEINDYSSLKYAGVGFVVADAHDDVKRISDVVLNTNGGFGVFREILSLFTVSHPQGRRRANYKRCL